MNITEEVYLEQQLIQSPKLPITEVIGVTFERPQIYGGFQNKVNARRRYVGEYLRLKSVDIKKIAKEIGVSVHNIKKYVSGTKTKEEVSVLINDWLTTSYTPMYQSVLEARKQAKIDAVTPKQRKFDGENKEQVRDYLVNQINDSSLKGGKFFTLPSHTCAFEMQINLMFDNTFHYVACEKEQDVFLKLTQTIAKENLLMSATFGNSNEVLSTCEPDTFSHAFLDYCGTFPTYENEVRNLLLNQSVKVDGLIALTFATREANNKRQTSLQYHKSIIKEFDCDVTPSVQGGIKFKLLSMLGINYKLVEFAPYKDDTSMIFALIKRVK